MVCRRLYGYVFVLWIFVHRLLCQVRQATSRLTNWRFLGVPGPRVECSQASSKCSIKRLARLVELWPVLEYDKIVVLAGVANVNQAGSIDETRTDLGQLSALIEQRFGRVPIVADPELMFELLEHEEYRANASHLNARGYKELFARIGLPFSQQK